mgnify:FL=1
MSNTAFSTPTSNPIVAQPSTASTIYVRSTSASDTMSASVYGTVSASPDSSSVTLTGLREAVTADSFTAVTQSILATAPAGIVSAYQAGTAGTGDITGLTNPTDGDTLTIGLTGVTQAYRFKNTLALAYDVKIGATASITMANLKAALNADGTPGTEYYTGTLVNPLLSATVATTVVTVTDRIACNRSIAWSFAESSTNFALRIPNDGADGTLLFSFAAGITNAANSLTFSTEDHLTETLPALMLGTSNHIQVNGVMPMLRLYSDQAISYKTESSTDLINWTTTSEGTVALSATTLTYVNLAERADFIRFVITTNANTTDTILDARLIY